MKPNHCEHCGESIQWSHELSAIRSKNNPEVSLWVCGSCHDRITYDTASLPEVRIRKRLKIFEQVIDGVDKHISPDLYARLQAYRQGIIAHLQAMEVIGRLFPPPRLVAPSETTFLLPVK